MGLIVYADFNDPACYLASQRIDELLERAVPVRWRAVEHERGLSLLGTATPADQGRRARELAEATRLALPGELPAQAPPPVTTNTRAAVAAYAEAVADGVQDEIRRRLFGAIWTGRQDLTSAYAVRRIITDVMYPRAPVGPRRCSSLPQPMTGDPDQAWATRRLGGTIAPDGGPLTTAGMLRLRAWREEWCALGRPRLPVLIDADGTVHTAAAALRRLADLVTRARTGGVTTQPRRCTGPTPTSSRSAVAVPISLRPRSVSARPTASSSPISGTSVSPG
ncbi:DsbA family protein [Actinocrinis puniceicyclus]|uniref:DsbA family protein n=1 Tax=Actinocrinis puniceicyclus TaxID=977794 RepID=A0A8J8BEX1_9ACTN|nr:DsbA family protein [Actinocrinis puniceicyclus]MBS2964179.1 DsbA family protein [Actinocrinis puniceicyclus]